MKKNVAFLFVFSLLLVMSFAMQLSVDAFLPPAKGGPTKEETVVKKSDADEVTAENLQDGLIYANRLIWEEQGGEGFLTVNFPSGNGFIAGATALYTVYPNINATLLAKRAAYLEAYYKAKGNMLQGLKGYFTRKQEIFREILVSIDTPEKNVGASLMSQSQTIEQGVNGLLRGYVTYEVSDDITETDGTVYVSIVISPKTLQSINKVTNGIFFARTVKDGLEAVLDEIQQGVIPPVGGKVVMIPDSGESVIVGFGSAIVRYSQNTKLASEYKKAALEASKMRATQALVEILTGSSECWSSGIYEGTASGDISAEYVAINQKVKDLTEEDTELKKTVAAVSSNEFLNVFIKTSDYTSFSQGLVPPGVIIRTAVDASVDKDGYGWAFTVAVYYPPLTLDIQNLFGQMLSGSVNQGQGGLTVVIDTNNPSENTQGPTGQVSDNSGL